MLPYYIHKPKRKEWPPLPSAPVEISGKEVLSGYVAGKKASDLEERAAISHRKLQIPFAFRARIGAFPIPKQEFRPDEDASPVDTFKDWQEAENYVEVRPIIPSEMAMNFPGELEIDLLADRKGVLWPIMIDGQIGHFMTEKQKDVDRQKTDAINIALRPYGAHPCVRVPFTMLKSQEASDSYFKELYKEW